MWQPLKNSQKQIHRKTSKSLAVVDNEKESKEHKVIGIEQMKALINGTPTYVMFLCFVALLTNNLFLAFNVTIQHFFSNPSLHTLFQTNLPLSLNAKILSFRVRVKSCASFIQLCIILIYFYFTSCNKYFFKKTVNYYNI